MQLQSVDVSALSIPFKVSFKHASAERAQTQAVWVTVRSTDGAVGYGEGCPREYVTGESVAGAQAFVAAHRQGWLASVRDARSLRAWVQGNRAQIDANPAAWTAMELALLDLVGHAEGRPVEVLLDLPPLTGRFRYTAVLGDAPQQAFAGQLSRYLQAGFRDFKIKLVGEHDRDLAKVAALRAAGISPQSVRADANNLWSDADSAIGGLKALQYPFTALEEPLRAGDYAGMSRIARALDTRIILDESIARVEQLGSLPGESKTWIVNLRVSKMGGVVRSIEFLREARRRSIGLIVGAHVGETSVLTRAALTVAASAGDGLIAQEGAFGTHLLERDVVEPSLMFGAGGILDAAALRLGNRPGWGLDPRPGNAR